MPPSPPLPAPLPPRLTLPLQQHIGSRAEPVVTVGERVLKGQLIARAADYVSAPLHAPTSGTVSAIAVLPIPHPSGLQGPCMVIDSDGRDAWAELCAETKGPACYHFISPVSN